MAASASAAAAAADGEDPVKQLGTTFKKPTNDISILIQKFRHYIN